MTYPVRLKEFEITAIQVCFRKHFGPQDHLWLFGSRTHLDKRGGDIDLYVEMVQGTLDDAYAVKIPFLIDLQDRIGEQKIDLVIRHRLDPQDKAIYAEARRTGVQLV